MGRRRTPCGKAFRHLPHDVTNSPADPGWRCPGVVPAASLADLLDRRPELATLPLPTVVLNRLGVACA